MDRLSAQVLFLCLFVRSQLTNTVTLGLVFLPKLLHPQKKVSVECRWTLKLQSITVVCLVACFRA